MTDRLHHRATKAKPPVWLAGLALLAVIAGGARAAAQTAPTTPAVLDKVVAVVNNRVILASDVEEEIRLAVLDPGFAGMGALAPRVALEQLISRSLVEQQIRQEEAQEAEASPDLVDTRLAEVRRELPVCVRAKCSTDVGWSSFLAAHDLTEERVRTYLRHRLQILRFIEMRFRQGIRISPQEVETYYRQSLTPQYSTGEAIPSLEEVAPRIQEILLQRQVNVLFDEWLRNLRRQGDVEILDPALEIPDLKAGGGTSQ